MDAASSVQPTINEATTSSGHDNEEEERVDGLWTIGSGLAQQQQLNEDSGRNDTSINSLVQQEQRERPAQRRRIIRSFWTGVWTSFQAARLQSANARNAREAARRRAARRRRREEEEDTMRTPSELNIVKHLSPEGRREYVADVLHTEKYESPKIAYTTTSSSSSSDASSSDEDDEGQEQHSHGDNECAICLECFEKGDDVSSSPNQSCKHRFHTECITEWLSTKSEDCPICRRDYLRSESAVLEYNLMMCGFLGPLL